MKGSLPISFSIALFLAAIPRYTQAQSSNPRVIAEAFECDDDLQPIPESTPPRKVGHQFHICIEPNLPTRYRNVRIGEIEQFGFFLETTPISQLIIDNGQEQDRTMTLVQCVPGSLTCSFKTEILPDFYYSPAVLNGTMVTGLGTITMIQMDGDGSRRNLRGLVQWRGTSSGEELVNQHHRRNEVFKNYAGQSKPKLQIPLEYAEGPPPQQVVVTDSGDEASWWQRLPDWAKYLIYGLGGLIILLCFCCTIFCLFFSAFWDREEQVATTKKIVVVSESPRPSPRPPKLVYSVSKTQMESSLTQMEEPSEEAEGASVVEGEEEETKGPSKEEFSPEEVDVCFDFDELPGTIAFYKALRKTRKEFEGQEYSVEVLRHIKKQLPDRKFFVFEGTPEDGKWRVMERKEANKRIRKEYKKMMKKDVE